MTAPVIGGSAIALAAVLVWRFEPEPPPVLDAELEREAERAAEPAPEPRSAPQAEPELPAPAVAAAEPPESKPASPQRAPLPGETPQTPMAALVAEAQNRIGRRGSPDADAAPEIAAGELEFAAEPVDSTWASGAEADVLAKLAQMQGLKLVDLKVECRSTMCRIELTQPASAGSPLSFDILRDSLGLEPRWMMMTGSNSTALRSIGYFWRDGFAPERPNAEPEPAN